MAGIFRVQLLLSLVGAAIVGGLIALLAYTSGVKTVPDVGGVYVEGIVGQPRFLNPLLTSFTDFPAETLDSLIFSGLTHPDSTGQAKPDLAESWTISPDGKQYTFYAGGLRAIPRLHLDRYSAVAPAEQCEAGRSRH
jgi:peptide/nickel transport system substrate-binding protein